MTYYEKLKDPRWQRLRLSVFERDEFTCQWCYSTDKELQIHHLSYTGEPWETPESELLTLCCDCHSRCERFIKDIRKNSFSRDLIWGLKFAADLLSDDPQKDAFMILIHLSDSHDRAAAVWNFIDSNLLKERSHHTEEMNQDTTTTNEPCRSAS